MPDSSKEITDSIMQPTDRLLELVGLASSHEGALTAFAGVQGSAELGLTVVGRLPSAGPTTFPVDAMASQYGRNKVLTALRKRTMDRGDLSAPFWRLAKAVAVATGDVEEGDAEWAERIGWTHLYRLAPEGEPLPDALRTLQVPLCAQLFWREILIWKPRRLLFMTGLEWAAPFVFAHHSSELERREGDGCVTATGALRLQGARTPAIVVVDPPTDAAAASECAAEIRSAFVSLGA